jgi:hypothetical protein
MESSLNAIHLKQRRCWFVEVPLRDYSPHNASSDMAPSG